MIQQIEKIVIDKDKFKKALEVQKLTMKDLSFMLGSNAGYISKIMRNGCTFRISDYKMICEILKVSEDDLKPEPEKPEQQSELNNKTEKSFQNLTKLIEHRLNKMQELVEKVSNDAGMCRSNINTVKIQNEKLKEQISSLKLDVNDSLADISEKLENVVGSSGDGETIRAKKLLSKLLSDGGKEENAIYLEAQKQKIAKKYIDRAKTELGLFVETKGYGASKTKKWFFG